MRVAIPMLHVDAPVAHTVVAADHVLLAGRTGKGARLSAGPTQVPVLADGGFSRQMPVPAMGENQIQLRTILAGQAPRTATLHVKRVERLADEARDFHRQGAAHFHRARFECHPTRRASRSSFPAKSPRLGCRAPSTFRSSTCRRGVRTHLAWRASWPRRTSRWLAATSCRSSAMSRARWGPTRRSRGPRDRSRLHHEDALSRWAPAQLAEWCCRRSLREPSSSTFHASVGRATHVDPRQPTSVVIGPPPESRPWPGSTARARGARTTRCPSTLPCCGACRRTAPSTSLRSRSTAAARSSPRAPTAS